MEQAGKRHRQLFVVATEPTPYKTDLFNALAELPGWRTMVLYAQSKDWAKDAGHDFRLMPQRAYDAAFSEGKGFRGQLASAWRLTRLVRRLRPNLVLVSGYNGIPYVTAMIVAMLAGIPFAFWVDQFNVGPPRRGSWPARIVRDAMRRIVFAQAAAVLVCGRPGRESALRAGCPEAKLVDFPYVVDIARIRGLAQASLGLAGWAPPAEPRGLILFSGRLIPRKGFDVLLEALVLLRGTQAFSLVVEGDGPMRPRYEERVAALGLQDRVSFVGFRQMDEHASLLGAADIVVVPSTEDPWGLVVHEGMLMGKPVCASDAVGAAVDRIESGSNGFLFPSGDAHALAQLLRRLLEDPGLRGRIGEAARVSAETWTPQRNAQVLLSSVLGPLEAAGR